MGSQRRENAKQLNQIWQINFSDAQTELALFRSHRHTPLQTPNNRNGCGERNLVLIKTILELSQRYPCTPLQTPRGKAHLGKNSRRDCSSKVAVARNRRNGCGKRIPAMLETALETS